MLVSERITNIVEMDSSKVYTIMVDTTDLNREEVNGYLTKVRDLYENKGVGVVVVADFDDNKGGIAQC